MKTLLNFIFFVTALFGVFGAPAGAYMVGNQIYSDIGTYSNPIYVEVKDLTPADPFADLTHQMNQRDLLNALNKQTEAINNATYQTQQTAQRNAQNAEWQKSQNSLDENIRQKNLMLERQRQHDQLMPSQASILEDVQRRAQQQTQQFNLLNAMNRQTQAINNATIQAQTRQSVQPRSATVAKTVSVVVQDYAKSISSTLSLGSSGREVRLLQAVLIRLGYMQGDATGFFGPKTKAAVSAYQKQNGLEAVGMTGPKTRALLNKESR